MSVGRVTRASTAALRIEATIALYGLAPLLAARLRSETSALVKCLTEAEDALHRERVRRVQAEALLAQLTTPSPTTPEPETVPL